MKKSVPILLLCGWVLAACGMPSAPPSPKDMLGPASPPEAPPQSAPQAAPTPPPTA